MSATIQSYIIEQVKKHGLPMLLLSLAVIYLHNRQADLEAKIEACHNDRIQQYEDRQAQLIEVVQANTQALKTIEAKLK